MKMNFFIDGFLNKFKYGNKLRPSRDWLVLVAVASLALVGIVIWTMFIFLSVVEGPSTTVSVKRRGVVVNNIALQKVRQIFDTRAVEQAKYESGEYTFVDPSKTAR